MIESAAQRLLEPGEVLFRTGDIGHEAYLIESGAVEIYVDRPEGRRVLALLGADDLFGELALIGDQTRTACARAATATRLSVITHDLLHDQLERAAPLLRHLLRVTLARCRSNLRMIGDGENPAPTSIAPATEPGSVGSLALTRLRLERAIAEAIEREELELFYQPIVRLGGGHVVGFEALARWRRSDGTLVPPGEFIWVLEDSKLILEFGRWVIRKAAADLRKLDAHHQPIRVDDEPLFCSVNLSVRQFGDPELLPVLRAALADHALQAGQLRLEITESGLLNNLNAALELIEQCRALGCRVVVDDFGTGYSSLWYLHSLPVDGLKLDRAFLQDSTRSDRGLRIVRAVGRLAADLDMSAIAEGIETPEQAAICHDLGLDYGQGYYFGRAVPLAQAQALLRRQVADL
ncbi:EAL domain-containing protein [Sinimarinibacterium thermocellulolyticum]|uniref:EAL domain-containing protein n=1 Tax=Sinimarinibacterium thermocellulolyticum TaxID=3170016 RepID=A0ABV2A5L7_9GAMM